MTRRVIPIVAVGPASTSAVERRKQAWRLAAQLAFFSVFVLTPVFDLFRYDLTRGHAYLLGMEWHLGIDAFVHGEIGAGQAAVRVLCRLFLPLLSLAGLVIVVAWKWGRLYCGWLCPHFSVVEAINRLMLAAIGKPSLWESRVLPERRTDGSRRSPDWRYWGLVLPTSVFFAALWAVVLLSYLMPPLEMYARLWQGALLRYEALFVGVATAVLSLEFLFARHLFCRYACAVGLFQSLAWMGNRGALVVGVDRSRLAECSGCLQGEGAACEAACPMRLKPRSIKRMIFACTQCAQCIAACAEVQSDRSGASLMAWVSGEEARQLEGGFKAPRTRRGVRRQGEGEV